MPVFAGWENLNSSRRSDGVGALNKESANKDEQAKKTRASQKRENEKEKRKASRAKKKATEARPLFY